MTEEHLIHHLCEVVPLPQGEGMSSGRQGRHYFIIHYKLYIIHYSFQVLCPKLAAGWGSTMNE